MGTLDAVFSGRWHMSPAEQEQARAIVRGFDEVVGRALAQPRSGPAVAVKVDFSGIAGALEHGFGSMADALERGMGGVIDAIDYNTGEVTLRLDRLGQGIEALRADFNWLMGDVIWKLELQNQTLTSILETLQAPLARHAGERTAPPR